MNKLLLLLLCVPLIGTGQLNTSFTTVPADCHLAPTGSIDLTVSGGTLPYTFDWFDTWGGNHWITEDIDSTYFGLHQVVIEDALGQVHFDNVTVSQPAMPISLSSVTCVNESSAGNNDGSISFVVSGGTPPYSFAWSNGMITQNISNLSAGNYSVMVTDANGCVETYNATLFTGQAIPFTSSISGTHAYCCGVADGAIDLTVSGGTLPYTYSWSNGSTTQDLNSLLAGTYSVLVTDSNGNIHNLDFTVMEPQCFGSQIAPSNCSACFRNESFPGAYDGHMITIVSGGSPPYSFFGMGPGGTYNTAFMTNLTAGTYTVTATDANGCSSSSTAIITANSPNLIHANFLVDSVCLGDNTTFTDLSYGGTLPYTYLWDFGDGNSSTLSNPTHTYSVSGSYTVNLIVTDANGLSDTTFNTLYVYSNPTANFLSPDSACLGDTICFTDLSIFVTNPLVAWDWSFGSGVSNACVVFTNFGVNNVTLWVTDAVGCVDTYTQSIFIDSCNISTGLNNYTTSRKLLKVLDILGRDTTPKRNTLLFYIFDDGTVEKRIIIE